MLDTVAITADVTIEVPITGIALTQIYFNSDENHTWTIDNIEITLDEVPCDGLSDCVSLKTSHDLTFLDACNLLLTGDCDTNAFGFNFEDLTFSLDMRVFGKIRNARYQNEMDAYRLDTGVTELVYANSRKVSELQIREIPD